MDIRGGLGDSTKYIYSTKRKNTDKMFSSWLAHSVLCTVAAWDLLTHLFQIKGKHYPGLVPLCLDNFAIKSTVLNFLSKEWQHLISLL